MRWWLLDRLLLFALLLLLASFLLGHPDLLLLRLVKHILEVFLRIPDKAVVANEYLAELLVDELATLLLVQDLGDVSILGLGVFSHPVDPVLLDGLVVMRCLLLQDLVLLERHANGLQGSFVHKVNPLILDAHMDLVALDYLLLGRKYQLDSLNVLLVAF